jgi:hypothetical protein
MSIEKMMRQKEDGMSDMEPSGKMIFKWWFIGLVLTVITVIIFTGLSYAGIIFQTDVERKVYEKSYQYKAGQKQKIAALRAQQAEIESQLLDPKLDSTTRRQLKAQQAAIRIQLRAATQR